MKHLLTLTLFLGIAWGQKEFHGYWHSISSATSVSVEKIYYSNGKQFSEYRSFRKPKNTVGVWYDDTSFPETKVLIDPWFGESYTERIVRDQTIKTKYMLIDKDTLLRGNSKYKRGFPGILPISLKY